MKVRGREESSVGGGSETFDLRRVSDTLCIKGLGLGTDYLVSLVVSVR